MRIRDRHGRVGRGASQSRHEAARSSTQFASYWTWPRRPRPRLGPSRAVIRVLGSGASQRAHRRTNRYALQIASPRCRRRAANGYARASGTKRSANNWKPPADRKNASQRFSWQPEFYSSLRELCSTYRKINPNRLRRHHDLAAESATADSPWRTCSARFGRGASIRKRSIIAHPKKFRDRPLPLEPTPPSCDIEQSAVFLYSCRFTSRQTSRSEASEHRDQPFDRPAWGHVS